MAQQRSTSYIWNILTRVVTNHRRQRLRHTCLTLTHAHGSAILPVSRISQLPTPRFGCINGEVTTITWQPKLTFTTLHRWLAVHGRLDIPSIIPTATHTLKYLPIHVRLALHWVCRLLMPANTPVSVQVPTTSSSQYLNCLMTSQTGLVTCVHVCVPITWTIPITSRTVA